MTPHGQPHPWGTGPRPSGTCAGAPCRARTPPPGPPEPVNAPTAPPPKDGGGAGELSSPVLLLPSSCLLRASGHSGRQQEVGFAGFDAFEVADFGDGGVEGVEGFGGELGDQVPAAVGGVNGLDGREAAQLGSTLSSTISRLENLPDRRMLRRLGRGVIGLYRASFRQVPKRSTLDIDDTFDAARGAHLTPHPTAVPVWPSPASRDRVQHRAGSESGAVAVVADLAGTRNQRRNTPHRRERTPLMDRSG